VTISILQLFLGAFIDNGERSNIQDCISACCDSPSCDIALMNGKRCFSVQCGPNATSCKEVPADSSPNASTLAYVARFVDTEHAQGSSYCVVSRSKHFTVTTTTVLTPYFFQNLNSRHPWVNVRGKV
jgi:hypothetical protein